MLDVGCGTGRYFHCLENVERLTGIDISPHMLEEAANPFKKANIEIDRIDLICANIFEVEIASRSFDFIYSIGVLGEHSPFDSFICKRLFDWLKSGGKVLFTVVDILSKPTSFRGRLAKLAYPLLPSTWRRKLGVRLMHFYMTGIELREILEASSFEEYVIHKRVSPDARWKGAHYVCIAEGDTRT